jgi:seryl-tRNA synthetase
MKQKLADSERAALVEEGKRIKQEISTREEELRKVEERLLAAAETLPNFTHPDSPVGATEDANREIEVVGEVPRFSFPPRDHVALGDLLDIVDFEHAAKVSGAKFYYLRNQGVFLELALTRYALDLLASRGFTPMITPDIARTDIVAGIGFNPAGRNPISTTSSTRIRVSSERPRLPLVATMPVSPSTGPICRFASPASPIVSAVRRGRRDSFLAGSIGSISSARWRCLFSRTRMSQRKSIWRCSRSRRSSSHPLGFPSGW